VLHGLFDLQVEALQTRARRGGVVALEEGAAFVVVDVMELAGGAAHETALVGLLQPGASVKTVKRSRARLQKMKRGSKDRRGRR